MKACKWRRGKDAIQALVRATGDSYRLVRIRAAASLAGFPDLSLTNTEKKRVETATKEYLDGMLSRPDQWHSHYNLGNHYLVRGEFGPAVEAYETSLKMEPGALMPMVNKSMAYARMGDTQNARETLKAALETAPESAVVNFNLALVEAQENDFQAAEKHLRTAIDADPQMAEAAYNLCVLLSRDRLDEAVDYCRMAAEIRPHQPRYAYTLAYYRQQKGDLSGASEVLERLLAAYPSYADAYVLLGEIYEKGGKRVEAERTYDRGINVQGIPDRHRLQMKFRLETLKSEEQKAD